MDAVVVEILNRRDHVQFRQRIEGKRSFTIGRSATCDVIVDDPYVAATHVVVDIAEDGGMTLADQNSVNGIWLKGHRIRSTQTTPLVGGDFRIGHTRIRVRQQNEQLAPERADGAAAKESRIAYGKWFAVGLIACAALLALSSWLDAPRDIAVRIAGMLVGLATMSAVWVAIWALLSRVMLLEWRWLTHGAILLCSMALMTIIDSLFDIGLFALDLRAPSWIKIVLGTVAAAGVLYLHLLNASPVRKSIAGLIAFLVPTLAFGTLSWVEARNQRQNVNYIDATQELFPPNLRMRTAKPLDGFFEAMPKLKAEADEKRRIALEEGDDEEQTAGN